VTTQNIPSHAGRVLAVVLLSVSLCARLRAAGDTAVPAAEHAVACTRIAADEYQSFLKNWDDKARPLLCAVIENPAQYDALFQPAAVMGNTRPFAPDPTLYAAEEILLVARVTTAPENMDSVFQLDRVTAAGPQLTLHYRFSEPKTDATFSVKSFLAVRVPKRDWTKVAFVENGKPVGELDPRKEAPQ
jgi:hypothetical protein